MARVTYNNLSIEVPENWEDATIITLLGPAPEALSLMSTRGVGSEQPNLVLRRQSFRGAAPDLESFADAQEAMMKELMNEVKVLDGGNFSIGEGANAVDAVYREFSFQSEPRYVQQLQVFFVVGQTMFTACGSGAAAGSFAQLRSQYLDTIRSIQVA